MQFRVIVITDPQTNTPTHTYKPTYRTYYNTLHHSQLQCSVINRIRKNHLLVEFHLQYFTQHSNVEKFMQRKTIEFHQVVKHNEEHRHFSVQCVDSPRALFSDVRRVKQLITRRRQQSLRRADVQRLKLVSSLRARGTFSLQSTIIHCLCLRFNSHFSRSWISHQPSSPGVFQLCL